MNEHLRQPVCVGNSSLKQLVNEFKCQKERVKLDDALNNGRPRKREKNYSKRVDSAQLHLK